MGDLGLLLLESFVSVFSILILFYSLDNIPKEQWDLIFGGEVCMWGEWGRL